MISESFCFQNEARPQVAINLARHYPHLSKRWKANKTGGQARQTWKPSLDWSTRSQYGYPRNLHDLSTFQQVSTRSLGFRVSADPLCMVAWLTELCISLKLERWALIEMEVLWKLWKISLIFLCQTCIRRIPKRKPPRWHTLWLLVEPASLKVHHNHDQCCRIRSHHHS